MSRLFLLIALAASSLLAGCASPDTMFHTGRDGRVFNPATGRFDWPSDGR